MKTTFQPHSWLLKASGGGIQDPLVVIEGLSLETENFPEGLKEAVCVLLLKKSTLDLCDSANYFPVLNLSFLGKVFERVASKQL